MSETISRGAGCGYVKADGTICMKRCFDCGKLNYNPAVGLGICYYCGFVPGKMEEENKSKVIITNMKRHCTKCSGYGRFSDEEPRHLTHCPVCRSIHPEALGLGHSPVKDQKLVFVYLAD